MKAPILLALSPLLCTTVSAEVEYARVVKETANGYIQHPAAARADFSEAFADFDPLQDGEKSADATFGAPRMLAVRIDGKTYLIQVDNTYGVFTLYRAARKGKTWVKTATAAPFTTLLSTSDCELPGSTSTLPMNSKPCREKPDKKHFPAKIPPSKAEI